MEKFNTVKKNLEKFGYKVSVFANSVKAADYLDSVIDGKTVGFGGSMTIQAMGLFDRLRSHNTVYSHLNGFPTEQDGEPVYNGKPTPPDHRDPGFKEAAFADVYISSINGLAETGEIINLDGYGNRVAAMLFGHDKVYMLVGRNKIAPDYESALFRARNVASPLNARRKGAVTPCTANNCDRCYDCSSPDRICNGMTVLLRPIEGMEYEVVLIDEDLGF